jgi:hypothetical protein
MRRAMMCFLRLGTHHVQKEIKRVFSDMKYFFDVVATFFSSGKWQLISFRDAL